MNDQPKTRVGAQTLALVANMAATIFAAKSSQDGQPVMHLPVDRQNIIIDSVSSAFEVLKEVSRQEDSFNEWLANKP